MVSLTSSIFSSASAFSLSSSALTADLADFFTGVFFVADFGAALALVTLPLGVFGGAGVFGIAGVAAVPSPTEAAAAAEAALAPAVEIARPYFFLRVEILLVTERGLL